jgi:two-component system response regulator BaeR
MSTDARSILIVEDDAKIADMMANYLHMHGYQTRVVENGLEAVREVQRMAPALVLLDLMLPGLDGIEVCREVRRFSSVPIIMVTARVDEIDRLLGLETGADDYVCKPFSPREVVARVKALLRRAEGRLAGQVPSHGFRVDEAAQRIHWQDTALNLTPVEFRLLKLLLSRPGHVFARARLLDTLHQDFRDVSDRVIDSHVKNLRRKIDKVRPEGSGIVSVYGAGYRFDPDAEQGLTGNGDPS